MARVSDQLPWRDSRLVARKPKPLADKVISHIIRTLCKGYDPTGNLQATIGCRLIYSLASCTLMTMIKKLQIFISSTYLDLIQERQAAVEAILRGGHIPAGMELFAAGDKSQLETIHRWIDESDIFMLILGGRYGSLEPSSGKSYTQLEYEYAIGSGKRFFALVLTDAAIDTKVADAGRKVLEVDNPKELKEFRKIVTSKICKMVDDIKDIKLAVHETLLDFLRKYTFDGWVSGKSIASIEELTAEITSVKKERDGLKSELDKSRKSNDANGYTEDEFLSIMELLRNDKMVYEESKNKPIEKTVLLWFYSYQQYFISGINNSYEMSDIANFLYFRVNPHLVLHGLTEDLRVTGAVYRTVKTTKKR